MPAGSVVAGCEPQERKPLMHADPGRPRALRRQRTGVAEKSSRNLHSQRVSGGKHAP